MAGRRPYQGKRFRVSDRRRRRRATISASSNNAMIPETSRIASMSVMMGYNTWTDYWFISVLISIDIDINNR
jgi:hypothetical protein